MNYELHLGDCLDVMPTLPANSIDSIVCDPPYGYSFMGANWDRGVPGVPFWEAALRVAKPGAMLLAFGGTRTHHRLTVAIEDAGWEIRDCLMWLYGSGFPKSMDIGKAIDKAAGAEREVVGTYQRPDGTTRDYEGWKSVQAGTFQREYQASQGYRPDGAPYAGEINRASMNVTAPATDAARTWDGWGTSLKPSWEPIIMAMKPLDGTYANTALVHGVAGLAIDQCRIGTDEVLHAGAPRTDKRSFGKGGTKGDGGMFDPGRGSTFEQHPQGRWPANLILDEEAAALLDEQSGERPTGGLTKAAGDPVGGNWRQYEGRNDVHVSGSNYSREPSTGGASRFFFCAKASSRERNEGLQGMEKRKVETMNSFAHPSEGRTADKNGGPKANTHPTVKPLELLKYLCRLTKTPFGGTVLDPFMGSGSTGCAAVLEGRSFVGIEIRAEYYALAQKRLEQAAVQPMLLDVTT